MKKNIILPLSRPNKHKHYCNDEKLNRQVRRARLRTKTGIIIFLSTSLIAAICILVLVVSSIFCITPSA